MSCDDESLSLYQCAVRRQIELFAASAHDVDSSAQGRNKPIILGQVGIRCRHCCMMPVPHRARAAVYYPAKLTGLYQAAQNMATYHLLAEKGAGCQHLPDSIREELVGFTNQKTKRKKRKSSAGGGKQYWADGVRVLGVYESDNGLRFRGGPKP